MRFVLFFRLRSWALSATQGVSSSDARSIMPAWGGPSLPLSLLPLLCLLLPLLSLLSLLLLGRPRYGVSKNPFIKENNRGIHIICLFGGAPRQCPWASTALHGYFHGIPRATADTPRAAADTPRASMDIPWASTEYRGK